MSRTAEVNELLRIARLVLAWDDVPKTVPSFNALRSLIDTGKDVAGLLKMVGDKVFKNLDRQFNDVAVGLQNAYIGKEKLNHGLPTSLVARIQKDTQTVALRVIQAAVHEAREYDQGRAEQIGAALAILPVSEMMAIIYKMAERSGRAGSAALRDAKGEQAAKGAATVVVAAQHDTRMIQVLETQVLPWLAQMSGGTKFPAQQLQGVAQRFAKQVIANCIDEVTEELVASYRTEKVSSMKQLLTFAVMAVALKTIELQELRLEQKAKVFVQFALPKIRDTLKQKQEQDRSEKVLEKKEEEAK